MTVFIAAPSYGQTMSSQTAGSLVALTSHLARLDLFGGFSALSFPDVVDIRNIYLSVWYDTMPNSTHMLFVDADMQFEPELVRDMLQADKPLVGCLYPKKRLPIDWVGSSLIPPAEPEGNLLELESVGCGVMLIRRDAVDAMLAKGNVPVSELSATALKDTLESRGCKRYLRPFEKVTTDDNRHLSEDFSFCYRHREAGGKVYAVINHVLCHIGPHQYAARYSDLYNDGQPKIR